MPDTESLDSALDPAVLAAEANRLLNFGRRFPAPEGGAYWLDGTGQPDLGRPIFTYSTARMAHVYALGVGLHRSADADLAGADLADADLADEALRGLSGRLHDDQHGGWFAAINSDGSIDDAKACYAHAFVVLAGASTVLAGRPGAAALLQEGLAVWQDRFFDPAAGMFVDSWNRTFTRLDPYRGANANMHAVEALLAAADATADPALLDQALGIARRIVIDSAEPQDWRIPEHFTPDWQPLLDHHRDQPDHPFQPYGATVGHGLEWSRLLLHLEAALPTPPDWLLRASIALFERAAADGWFVDGRPGFVYTTDWDGTSVVRDRMHWVTAEAIAAAAALHRRTDEARFADLARTWWGYAEDYHFDRVHGSWIHQLDADLRPTDSVWPGKPDLYHAVQATLIPRYPLAPCLAASVHAPQ